MKKLSLFPSMIIGTLILSACGGAQLSSAPTRDLAEPYTVAMEMPAGEAVFAEDISPSSIGFNSASEPVAVERLVIRNANLTLVVEDPAGSAAEIADLAEALDGFVVNSNVYQTTFAEGVFATQANITIRVPAERLDEALEQIKHGVVEVRSENISGQDVTQEYTDLESRLRNLEAAEEELREILGSLTKADDVLNVYQSLRQVREEIEVIKGRMQYFEQSARLSAISIDLLPDVVSQPLQIGRWQPQGTAKAALEALLSALQFLANAAIWLIVFALPVLALLSIPFWVLRWWVMRRRTRRLA
ncbi:MAG: DUF4349 domain-containing protein, partial [Anaerolineales bacterium]|nr:DUF4349 domain-containing protein [Anaerolineales bacterium]